MSKSHLFLCTFLLMQATQALAERPTASLFGFDHDGEIIIRSSLPRLQAVLKKIDEEEAMWPFCATAEEVRSHMDDYILLVAQARKVCRNCQIGILLMEHISEAGYDTPQPDSTYESQQRLIQLFTRGRWDLIAVENQTENPLTFETYALSEAKVGMSAEEVRAQLLRNAPVQAWAGYLLEHPGQRMIGLEDEPLHRLCILWMLAMVKEDGTMSRTGVSEALMDARSEIGLAKLLVELDKQGGTTGAITFGYEHRNFLIRSAEWLGVSGQLVDTRYANGVSP
jgi:hypothetical protein